MGTRTSSPVGTLFTPITPSSSQPEMDEIALAAAPKASPLAALESWGKRHGVQTPTVLAERRKCHPVAHRHVGSSCSAALLQAKWWSG